MLSALALLSAVIMDNVNDMCFPAEAMRGEDGAKAASRRRDDFNTEMHRTLPVAHEGEEQDPFACTDEGGASTGMDVMRLRAERAETMRDGRGRHEDRSRQSGTGYAQVAFEHLQQVEAYSLGRPCLRSCP